jgi:4-amino-4-deoxy-L-arabinose transferase-like glycosyltransferase
LAIVCYLFNFDGAFGQDSYAYLFQINHIETLTSQDAFYPPFYAFLGWIFQWIFQNPIFSLQWVSLLSWFGASLLLYKIAIQSLQLSNKIAGIGILVLFTFSPFVMRMSLLVMSDSLALFMAVLSIYLGLFSKQKWSYALFFVVAALALLTRYALVPLLVPTLFLVIYRLFQHRSFIVWIRVLIGTSIGLTALLVNMFYLTNENGSTQHSWLQLWDLSNYFNNSFDHQDGLVQYTFPNIVYVLKNIFHPIYALLLIPALFFFKKSDLKSVEIKILLISYLLYTLFLAGIPFQNDRFLLPAFPFMFLVLLPTFERLYNRLAKFKWLIWLVIPIQLVVFLRLVKPVYERNQLELYLFENLQPYANKKIYSFDVDIALAGRGLKAEWLNLWKENYSSFSNGAFVLFNEKKFAQQWKGKNPMLNWETLNKNYQLIPILKLEQGWEFYKIKDKIDIP